MEVVLLQTTGIIICSGALEGQREGGAVGREAFSPDRKEVRIAHSAAQRKHRTAPRKPWCLVSVDAKRVGRNELQLLT